MSNESSGSFSESSGETQPAQTLQDAMRDWEIRINILTPEKDIDEVIAHALNEINATNPMVGKKFLFSGEGVLPIPEQHEDQDDPDYPGPTMSSPQAYTLEDGWGEIINGIGIYQAVQAVLIDRQSDKPYWRLLQKFKIGTQESTPCLTTERVDTLYCYLTADTTLLPIDDIESAYVPNASGEIEVNPSVLTISSLQLVRTLNSTAFRRMKRTKQQVVISKIIEDAEIKSGIRDTQVILEAEYCYAPFVGEAGVYQTALDIRSVLLSGLCLGVESLESIRLQQQAVRSDRHLLDKNAGLCVVVDPEPDVTQELRLPEGQILYVPTLSQRVHASFSQFS